MTHVNTVYKPHVLIAISSLLIGGTEIQTLSVVEVLVNAGYRVTVCCYYEYHELIVTQFEAAGAEVVRLRLQRCPSGSGFARFFKLMKSLVIYFKNINPEIVHVQYITPGLIPIVAARLAGIHTVLGTVHYAWNYTCGIKAKLLLKVAAQLCTAFICVSEGAERSWFVSSNVYNSELLCKSKHFTICNAVDTERVETIVMATDRLLVRKCYCIPDNAPVIGIVGRLDIQKGHSVILDALPSIMEKFPTCVLLVIGGGSEREQLQNKALCLGIDHSIRWIGECPQEEVFELYSVMDMLVMPSFSEGLPLTAVEAMAAHLPVIGTEVGGVPEVIDHGVTGYLVKPGDCLALAASIVKLLQDPALSHMLGKNGSAKAKEKHSIDRFSKLMLGAYQQFSTRRNHVTAATKSSLRM